MGQIFIIIELIMIMQSTIIIFCVNSLCLLLYIFANVNILAIFIIIKTDDHQSISIELIY